MLYGDLGDKVHSIFFFRLTFFACVRFPGFLFVGRGVNLFPSNRQSEKHNQTKTHKRKQLCTFTLYLSTFKLQTKLTSIPKAEKKILMQRLQQFEIQ